MLDVAIAHGINHFDTGPSYADGEARLGLFLKSKDLSRLVISTKVGTEHGTHNRSFDPARMRGSFDGSLERIGISSVDILYLHGPTTADLSPAVMQFFAELKSQGKIRYAGVNSFAPEVVEACIGMPWIDVVMLQYSVSDRRFDRLIDRLSEAGKVVIAGTIMAQGIFELKTFLPRDAKSFWYLLRALKNDPLFPIRGWRLARRIAATGLSPHEAAIRFAVSNDRITSNLFGTSSPAHIAANARAGSQGLDAVLCRMLAGTSEKLT